VAVGTIMSKLAMVVAMPGTTMANSTAAPGALPSSS
jgi:hypothetical protein